MRLNTPVDFTLTLDGAMISFRGAKMQRLRQAAGRRS